MTTGSRPAFRTSYADQGEVVTDTKGAQLRAAKKRIEQVRQNAAHAAEKGYITWAEADRLVSAAYAREASDGT